MPETTRTAGIADAKSERMRTEETQMALGVESINAETLLNNIRGLARAAKVFNVPVLLASVAEMLSRAAALLGSTANG